MTARYFAEYVNDLKTSGTLSIETAALVCHGEAELEAERTFDTAMGGELYRPSLPSSIRAPSLSSGSSMPQVSFLDVRAKAKPSLASGVGENDPLRLVFPLVKRPGTAFDHISVGRTDSVDVVLPLLQVSKFHAYFSRDTAGQFTLADAGSKNGTWIGARRLGIRSPEAVRDGARIRLGPYVFTFLTRAGFLGLVTERAAQRQA
jgi:hypothetical protein